ncbi:hypothetical protein N9C56_14175 [Paracoccaceae bacterium]|nr:hypothetical protein [Paracoccaceae bacterium]
MPISESFESNLTLVLPRLIESYPTPFHIYDEEGIISSHKQLVDSFSSCDFRLYFAVKALPNKHILSLLRKQGSGFDCSSIPEFQLCKDVGAVGSDILFVSNNTSHAELQGALEIGADITFDDLKTFENCTQLPERVAFRLSPGSSQKTDAAMGGAINSKFGVPFKHVFDAYQKAKDRGVKKFGIHRMTYTNETDTEFAVLVARELISITKAISDKVGVAFDYINFGGGLGTPFRPTDSPLDLTMFGASVCQEMKAAFPCSTPKIILE